MSTFVQSDQLLEVWLQCLSELMADVEAWASELGWSTRRIEMQLSDSEVGKYQVPSLLLAKGECEIWINPRDRNTSDYAGVVEIYLMPVMDDVVTLLFKHDHWTFQVLPQSCIHSDCAVDTGESLSRESFGKVLDVVMCHEV